MATVDVMRQILVPGLNRDLVKYDMEESTIMYNGLQRIQPEMYVDIGHVKRLVDIIVSHDQLGKFSTHLVHRHDPIANDKIRLELDLGVVPGKWNKPTPIDSLDLSNIHGVTFKFVPEEHQFVPFEFGHGSSPISRTNLNDRFLIEFARYLTENNLTDTLALEIVHPGEPGQPGECTAELEVGELGTVVLPKSIVNASAFLPTGWPGPFLYGDGDPPAGQTWAKKTDGSHQVFINKPTIGTSEEMLRELARQGLVKWLAYTSRSNRRESWRARFGE